MLNETIKILKENIGSKISDVSCSNIFFLILIYLFEQGKQKKNKQMGLYQTKVFAQHRKPSTK